jgi:hypothetical protein
LGDAHFHLEVIRASAAAKAADGEPEGTPKHFAGPHQEGGHPPESKYRAGKTIWKWTTPTAKTPKRWIEFDRKSGMMAKLLPDSEIDSDFDDEDFDDSIMFNDDGLVF